MSKVKIGELINALVNEVEAIDASTAHKAIKRRELKPPPHGTRTRYLMIKENSVGKVCKKE